VSNNALGQALGVLRIATGPTMALRVDPGMDEVPAEADRAVLPQVAEGRAVVKGNDAAARACAVGLVRAVATTTAIVAIRNPKKQIRHHADR
jgi:hypothetical protein